MFVKVASSLVLIGLVSGNAAAQNSGPIFVWLNGGAQTFRYESGQAISLTNINNTINRINIWDSEGGNVNSIGAVFLDGGVRSAALPIIIGSGSFPSNPANPMTPAAFNFGGLTLGSDLRPWSQLAGAINGNFTGFISVGAIWRLQSDNGDIVAPVNATYTVPGVGFSGSRAIANIRVRTIAANVTADNGLIETVEAAAIQRSVVASTGEIFTVNVTGSAGINLLPGSQISARTGIRRVTALEINATIIANNGNLNGGNIDLLQTTSGGFSGSLQATNLTNTTPGTSGLVTAGTLSANVTLEGSVQSRVVAPSATGAMLVKQAVSGPMTTTAVGFSNLTINGLLNSTLTMASTAASATINVNSLASTGRVIVTGAHVGNLNFGSSSPTGIKGLGSQVILNAGNATPNAWTGNIRYAGGTLLLPAVTYDDLPADLGGGAVDLAPFRFYQTDSIPSSATNNALGVKAVLGNQQPIRAAYYGPLTAASTPMTIQFRQNASQAWTTLTSPPFSQTVSGRYVNISGIYTPTTLPIDITPFIGEYQAIPTAALRCADVTGNPGVDAAVIHT